MGTDLDLTRTSPRGLLGELTKLKLVRYSAASAVAVPVGLGTLWILTDTFGWGGIEANLASVALGSIPNYLINRYWTWQQRGRNRLWTEIVPFWVMALLGTLLSTLAVAYADDRWGTPLAMSLAQLSGFGAVWFARFLILDKVMWRVVHELHPEIEGDEEADDPGTRQGAGGDVDGGGDGTRPTDHRAGGHGATSPPDAVPTSER